MGPPPGQATFNDAAPGYEAAMHGACISCHQQEAEAQNRPALGQCTTCHRQDDMETVDVGEIESARK
jgi:cytochrome c553